MKGLRDKYKAADTTIFTVMSALAQQHQAINLSQGFPDFPVDPELVRLLQEAAAGGANQYAPMTGLPGLRTAIAADIQARQGVIIDPDTELTITPGATYGIYTALAALLDPGDEVIVFEPAYDSYIPNISSLGARAVPVPLLVPSFTVDWDRLKAAITPNTRAIIVNTPHNPSGTVWRPEDWEQLAMLLAGTDIYVIADEVYEQLVYDGRRHSSVLDHEVLRSRCFAVYSFGKVFHNTGWKVGYCIAAPELTRAFRRLHQYLCFSVNTPAQQALAAYIALKDRVPAAQGLQDKRDYFLAQMRRTAFDFLSPSAGSYFQLATYAALSDRPDTEMARWLTTDCGVAVIPVSAFYADHTDHRILRFCFAKQEQTLAAAADRLALLEQFSG